MSLQKLSAAISSMQRLELQLTKDADAARQRVYASIYSTDASMGPAPASSVVPPRISEIRLRRRALEEQQQLQLQLQPPPPPLLSAGSVPTTPTSGGDIARGDSAVEEF